MTRKIILYLILMLSSFFSIYSEEIYEDSQEMYDFISVSREPVIKKGIKEAQENVTTIFSYNENDSYRIYCRANNLTTMF